MVLRRRKHRRDLERGLINRLAGRVVIFLVRRGVSPLHLTYGAFILSIASSILYALTGLSILFPVFGGVVWLASGFFDAIDGEVARLSSKTSRLGAYVDSILDKAAEAVVCLGLLLSGLVDDLAVLVFCVSSLLVSYSRARAEGVGVSLAGVGIAERAERIILVSAASLITPFYPSILNIALYLGATLASITVVWRTIYVVDSLRRERQAGEA
ncbi:MAG: CDP-alcohol phosphatidyltransferase family protein [Nitrososphaerota archaeon]